MLLEPGRAALLVVDIQEKLMPAIHGKDSVVRSSVLLLHVARTLALPIVLTTQYAKGLGPLLPEVRQQVPEAAPRRQRPRRRRWLRAHRRGSPGTRRPASKDLRRPTAPRRCDRPGASREWAWAGAGRG